MHAEGPFDAIVFAGGGCRCFWQVGFLATATPALGLKPLVASSVSAGSAMACMFYGGIADEGLEYFKRRTAANPRNVYPRNLLQGTSIFPHAEMYRDTLVRNLAPEAIRRLRDGPDIRVLLARIPSWLGPRSGVLAGLVAYQGERLLAPDVHARLGRRLGFSPELVSVRECSTGEEIADLVLQSSCTPPFTPVYSRAGRPVLDGGLVDHVPVEGVESARHALILLTRQHPEAEIPRIPGRTYVQPSEPIPVKKWDYTSPDLVQKTYDLGRRDGERFARNS